MAAQDNIYQYFDRDPELRVLFVFQNELLAMELRDAQWREGYRFVDFKGDWFTTKYRLDHEWKDERIVMYFKDPSPLKEKSRQKDFYLMDVLTANMAYEEQSYVAFMQQFNIPNTDRQMVRYIESNIKLLQTDKMVKLLQSYYHDRSVTTDLLTRGVLSHYLGKRSVLGWDDIIVQMLLLGKESEQKKLNQFFIALRGSQSTSAALQDKLQSIFGVGFNDNSVSKVDDIVKVIKYNAIVQNLAPVEADTYRPLRIDDSIALQQLNRIFERAMSNEQTAAAFQEVMTVLGAPVQDEKIIEWYGTDANYSFLPQRMCQPIITSLLENKIETDPELLISRMEDLMLKNSGDPSMAKVMDYSISVARLYMKLQSLGTITLNKPDEYVLRYQEDYYVIDQLYRQSLESYFGIEPSNALFAAAQQVKINLDVNYAKFANRLNLGWIKCIKDAGGMTAVNLMRQNDFYDEKVKPLGKKVAVIVSDALRYEVAQEIVDALAKSKHIAQIKPALAMLPTETKYCKPSLLPHRTLKLYGVANDQDMSVDDNLLNSTEKRTLQLQRYSEGGLCVTFDKVAEYVQDTNREIFKHQVVYIFHDAIDKVGHDGTAQEMTAACRKAIDDIARMIPKIHASYNVSEVLVTSDHGFLFNDMVFAEKDKHKIEEETLERSSRYYLTRSGDDVKGIVKFPLNTVSEIDNAADVMVAVPMGTNRLNAPSGGYMFTHGGASLQEMVIPIITSRLERKDNKQPVGVMVLGTNLSLQSSRLRFTLLQTEAVSMDMKERTITVAIYHNNEPVTPVKEIALTNTDPLLDNRKVPVDLTLTKHVDAKVLQLKVYDATDEQRLNPLLEVTVTNNTLIETDF